MIWVADGEIEILVAFYTASCIEREVASGKPLMAALAVNKSMSSH